MYYILWHLIIAYTEWSLLASASPLEWAFKILVGGTLHLASVVLCSPVEPQLNREI